ncbi:MAG TPA: CDP-diacylglycerol--glycerol-3-phosphate 3-phosphatidyltransferase [Acidobacteriota bacterium]|jgi:CDP-diacylglycerol--glycerol-3-phosphate 3-phosphatidyltransferase|nr:CDP-diacylglycerol--glycerol-3-phosphate 3-phosphatidyltransferase [Acidobacteriota bacterium]HRR57733.1 CDP-diacylglycerol--glycerol-3-phosphate 3-phosphatidyltransferase [Acidobacteriota bacterium]HRV07916.1 CDP-diacylglycerol--glycerol-3-phosphate 3-phosphatidyltransferase [Acidobacteriota bacterium]
MNLPTALTVSRIFLVPLLLVVLLTGNISDREFWGLVVFLAAAGTDYFDGYFARRREQVTRLGKLLDPLADKILISAALVALVELGVAPAWMVIIIIGREFAVTGLRSIASAEGLTIAAARGGKLKMVAQVVCCAVLIAGSRSAEGWLPSLGYVLLWVVVVLSLVSLWQYFQNYWGRIGEPVPLQTVPPAGARTVNGLPHPGKRQDALINS